MHRRQLRRRPPAARPGAQNVFEMLRENVLVAERALLYTLGFNFRIEKPYQHITARALRFQGVEPEGVRFLTQIAWNFVNDRCAPQP